MIGIARQKRSPTHATGPTLKARAVHSFASFLRPTRLSRELLRPRLGNFLGTEAARQEAPRNP